MATSLFTRCRRASLPALIVFPLLIVSWLAMRFFYAAPAVWPALAPHLFLGWIVLVFLLTTAAAILWTAAAPPFPAANILRGNAILLISIGILFLLALFTGLITLWDALRVYFLLIPWTCFWSLLANGLRRFSASLAVTVCLTLSALFFAAPITAVPLAHASSHWNPAAHELTLTAIAYATPLLPAFHALNDSLPDAAGWSEWPVIYRLADTGQEIGLRARWPTATLLYALLALPLIILNCLHRRAPP